MYKKEYIPAQAVDSNSGWPIYRPLEKLFRLAGSGSCPQRTWIPDNVQLQNGGQYHDPVISLWWYCIL